MAFTVGTGTFTNGSATVTNVALSSGTLAYFASGTRMVVGVNPVVREVEAVAAPTVTTITLRSPWQGTGGTYDFLANQTSEGLRDAVQAIRSSNATIQSFIDSIDVQNTNDSVVQRTANGRVKTSNATESNDAVALGQINSVAVGLTGDQTIAGVKNFTSNIGFGTTSPPEKLSIVGAGDLGIQITKAGAVATRIRAVTAGLSFGVDGASGLTERMRIAANGNVLVGTTSGDGRFNIAQSGVAWAQEINHTNDGVQFLINFKYDGSQVGFITANNTTTTYSTSSDYRLKHDIKPMAGALAKVQQLKPVTYKWNLDSSEGQGFIAHELQEVCPDAVIGEKDAVDADGNPVYQGIDTSFLVATLTAAIQELKAELDTVKAELQTLKGN